MYKCYAILMLLLLSVTAISAPRQKVILEHFTNTGCGPCASNNPTLHSAMNAMTRDTVIKISVHPWWPSASDPFYAWNTSDNTSRTNYYGVSSVPDIKIDGVVDAVYPFNYTDIRNRVRSRYNTESPCTIVLNAYSSSSTQISFTGTIEAEEDLTNMRLFVALISDVITYGSPPGSNGETVFPDPLRDMYPNASLGETFSATPGTPYDFSGVLSKSSAWDIDNLSVVAFVQNPSTRSILQGEWTEANPFTLTSPVGGEVWTYPESHDITWNAGYAEGNVLIELNRDYPTGAWETLFASTDDDGVESWTVTEPASSNCRIRISSLADPQLIDVSLLDFTIQVPSITVVQPNGGEVLNGEELSSVEWTSTALSGNVLIELNRYYPAGAWETIGTFPNSSQSIVLGVPPTINARIRLTSVNGTVRDRCFG